MAYRSGFVALIGRPNVGKSTLLNGLLREKVAIVSERPQTTRNNIRGILTDETYQVVFLDTPGIHRAKDRINRQMVQSALSTLREMDLLLFLVEPDVPLGKGDRYIAGLLGEVETRCLVVVNKIDLAGGGKREACLRETARALPDREVFPVSALTGEGVDGLLDAVVQALPPGEPYFPPDQYTDQPLRFLAAELIREQVFRNTGEEVPYAVAVEIVSFVETGNEDCPRIRVEAHIHVERASQKGILIGKGGEMLRRIGTEARKNLEAVTGAVVFLRLWVKVSKGWRNDPKTLRRLGYR